MLDDASDSDDCFMDTVARDDGAWEDIIMWDAEAALRQRAVRDGDLRSSDLIAASTFRCLIMHYIYIYIYIYMCTA